MRPDCPRPPRTLLSQPTKLPADSRSWGLPAGPACPYALTRPGAVCTECYAKANRYAMDHVAASRDARWTWTRACLRTDAGTRFFVETLADRIDRSGCRYFRVDDAGDLFSPRYTRAWTAICGQLPHVRFWVPTLSWRAMAHSLAWDQALRRLAALENVTVRPSSPWFEGPPVVVDGLHAGTFVSRARWDCPASLQDDHCGDCRRCWEEKDRAVGYHRKNPHLAVRATPQAKARFDRQHPQLHVPAVVG